MTLATTPVVFPNPIFEGSEKRVEINFRLSPSSPENGLRSIPRDVLDELMTLARCCIVSSRSNEALDAYVLSESSLFVYPTKWILKTCGTTRLLNSVPRLLEVAAGLGMQPSRCKYSRASFLFPDQQPFPYTSFEAEAQFLEQYFGHLGSGGQAFVLGEQYDGLQWHVYVAAALPVSPSFKPTYNLEVCMTELGREAAAQFYRTDKFISAEQTTKDSGIIYLKPKAIIDDYVFEPCGYSMNGIDGTGLITIHITPEPGQSYASVEVSGFVEDIVNPSKLLSAVVGIFQPGKVSVALSVDSATASSPGWAQDVEFPKGYSLQGASAQQTGCESLVSYYTLCEGEVSRPGSPVTVLHHAASVLSINTTSSDSEGDSQ